MMFVIDVKSEIPIYVQLKEEIRGAIVSGRLRNGDRMPTVRQLAVDLGVNANTVAKVYSDLEAGGFISTHQGKGSYVAKPADDTWESAGSDSKVREVAVKVLEMVDAEQINMDDFLAALLYEIRRRKDH
jgi:GntR family transcriptional regulator